MKRSITISLCSILLAGCALTPDYQRPNVNLPPAWNEAGIQTNVDSAQAWWKSFDSPELNSLMATALENNTNLLAGVQRIEQARASLKIAGATLLPSVNASGNTTKSRTNPASGGSSNSTSLRAGIDISYELDLFGANRAGILAAQAGLDNSVYNQGALELTLMGDVATGYFTLANLRERLAIADNNLDIAKELLRIIEARVREGAASDLELAQQKGAVASSEASRASLVEQIKNAENALAVLLGAPPQTITVMRNDLHEITIPLIAPGQPSQLLQRRPDLLASEASLIAANANIGAARAAFYPSISLGLDDTISLAGFGEPSTTILSLAASIGQPIFQGGRLQGGLEQATARQLELVQIYRGNVLTAFQEVEDALIAVQTAQLREEALQTAMKEAKRAYQLSKHRYDAGAIDFQTLLDTQNTQLSTENSHAQAKLARLTACINLYRALGGGWASQ